MQINVTGHNLEITTALKSYIDERAEKLTRHFDKMIDVKFILEVQKEMQKAEASILVSGNQIFAEASHDDMYHAIDDLTDKLDRQLIKHKEKLRDHHRSEGNHRKIADNIHH